MTIDITRYADGAPEHSGAPFDPDHGTPRLRVLLSPHKALTPNGFVWFVGLTASLLLLPLLAVFGTPVLWGLLPFVLAALWALWWGLTRSWRDAERYEELLLWDDHLRLTHAVPRKAPLRWDTNPYWVRLRLIPEGGKVPDYVTLKAGGREVEIGAFLAPSERRELYALLSRELGGGI
ncbi:DUF2244 domain-containing protein [Rhodobacteraceae bacterium W635]|uniref:DUF2244 domain-containing protein n=1 Tax=Nioella halotolerans TaxID=2303578 RepID=UPI000E3E2DCC|nr:DUF2244 domain-containing protein [Rhodobacteraceae bacterium W635]